MNYRHIIHTLYVKSIAQLCTRKGVAFATPFLVQLLLLGVYNVLAQLLIILLQSQLLARVLLSLVIVSSVIHVSRNTIFGVALRYKFY